MRIIFAFVVILSNLILFADNAYQNYSSEDFLQLYDFNHSIDLSNVDLDLIEAGVYFLSNEYRAQKETFPLQYNDVLSNAAYLHSEQMEKYGFFDHTNRKNKTLSTLEKRVQEVGYRNFETIAENIFYGYIHLAKPSTYRELCQLILDNFIESKDHRMNLLAANVKKMGNGVFFESKSKNGFWYFYFTQDFGRQF